MFNRVKSLVNAVKSDMRDNLGSVSRVTADKYASMIRRYDDDEETASQYRQRLDLAKTLPDNVRRMIENGRY
jgi:hypothetical protein